MPARRRVERRTGVDALGSGDLALRRAERRVGERTAAGEAREPRDVPEAADTSETSDAAERERVWLRIRGDGTSSMSLTSDSARRLRSRSPRSRRSSCAVFSTTRRRPYGEITAEIPAPSPIPSHSAARLFVRLASACAAASGTAIALRSVREDEPTRSEGRPEKSVAVMGWGLRMVSSAARMRSASFLCTGLRRSAARSLSRTKPLSASHTIWPLRMREGCGAVVGAVRLRRWETEGEGASEVRWRGVVHCCC